MSETHPSRRIGQSIVAVIAGMFVGIVITLGTDVMLHAVGVFPPWGASIFKNVKLPPICAFLAIYNKLPNVHPLVRFPSPALTK